MVAMTHLQLSEVADNLSFLAGIFQVSAVEQKAYFIRRAERSLLTLESFFTDDLVREVRLWKDSHSALQILQSKQNEASSLISELEICQQKVDNAKEYMQKWFAINEFERSRLLQEATVARHFLKSEIFKNESYILNRYQRYHTLKELLPFADKSEHLCEAIFHFENRARYEANLIKLEQKKEKAIERLHSVRRGFVFALIFCIFIITMPLCIPIAISLWNRRREIETQIANIEETNKREERRIQAADEGAIASEAIRTILGEVPLEHIRRTLNELRELRSEFNRTSPNNSITTRIMNFLDLNQLQITELFGSMPSECLQLIKWFVDHVEKAQIIEQQVNLEESSCHNLNIKLSNLTRGYGIPVLQKSIINLHNKVDTTFIAPIDTDLKIQLAEAIVTIPPLLLNIRKSLWNISNMQPITEKYWQNLQMQMRLQSSILCACKLAWYSDSEINSALA